MKLCLFHWLYIICIEMMKIFSSHESFETVINDQDKVLINAERWINHCLKRLIMSLWSSLRSWFYSTDEFDAYIVVSFVNATLVLSIGETVEEITDSGFLGTTPTLTCSLLGDDALLQVSLANWFRHTIVYITAIFALCKWQWALLIQGYFWLHIFYKMLKWWIDT